MGLSKVGTVDATNGTRRILVAGDSCFNRGHPLNEILLEEVAVERPSPGESLRSDVPYLSP
jgi:hypothetical protein